MAHVVWDWNGTLLADLEATVDAVNHVMRAFARPEITVERYANSYCRPVAKFYEQLLGGPISDDDWRAIDRLWHDRYHAGLHDIPLAHDARSALERVAESGHTQSILSMWFHDLLGPEVARRELAGHFVRIDGSKSESGPPKSAYMERHAEQLRSAGIEPSDILVIGDTTDDAEAARAIGANAVLVSTTQAAHRLEASGFPVVASLTDALAYV